MAATQPSFATIRVVNRLAIPCTLDAVMVGRMDRDFIDALILLAIVQANVAPVSRDRVLQRTYARYDEPPPDELRRPVSINAVAHSLRLPYETVRRRVMRLAKENACEISAQGVIVPARELSSPRHLAALMAAWTQIQKLYYQLRELGVLDHLVTREERDHWASNRAEPPIRAVIRIASDYMLRVVDNVTRRFGSLIAGVIWFTVLRANTERLLAAERGGPGVAPADFVDDARRQPVRMAEIAQRLAAPQETVRRYVSQLIEAGALRRTQRGLIVPAAVLARPNAVQLMQDNFNDLQRMFAGLAQLGVLAEWDRQDPALVGAA